MSSLYCDITNGIRNYIDLADGVVASLGLAPYAIYLTQIVNDHVAYNDPDGYAVRTDTRITVKSCYCNCCGADGYDGYLNPPIRQKEGQQLVISNGALTANEFILGPLV